MVSLLHAAQAAETRIEEAFAAVGLSHARYNVLEQLVRAGEPLPLSEIASRLCCVRSNMTQLIDRLEADGLVKRVNDSDDRRSIRAELTVAGREVQAAGAEQLRKVHGWLDAALPQEERAALARALATLG